MAERSPDKGKEPFDLESKMEARIQQPSEEFNQQICCIQQRVEHAHYAHNNKMNQLLAAF